MTATLFRATPQLHGVMAWIHRLTRSRSPHLSRERRIEKIEASRLNPPPCYLKAWLQVKEYLESELKYDFTFTRHLLSDDLVRAVAAVRGPDERTLRKWPRIFEEYGI
jgi:hypothetical protein